MSANEIIHSSSSDILLNTIAEEASFDNLDALLRDTLTRLGFVIPEVITKNEAFVGEAEKERVLKGWRNFYTTQLRQLAMSLTVSTRIKGAALISLLKKSLTSSIK